jgi:hypothetical protein
VPSFVTEAATTERTVISPFSAAASLGRQPQVLSDFSERLFLFGLEASRDALAANPAKFSARAALELRAGSLAMRSRGDHAPTMSLPAADGSPQAMKAGTMKLPSRP